MSATDHVVLIVDDDHTMREALLNLLAASDLHGVAFGSASEYIAHPKADIATCLILDVELPDINGLDLQRQIGNGYHPPIIFLTGRGDIPSSVRAIKAGALDFLTKPFDSQQLLQLVHTAFALDRERRRNKSDSERLQRHFESLTPREREVLPLVVSGLLNKQAAAHLGISEVTLQTHRTNLMRKMEADSLAELVRMAASLGIPVTRTRH
jgi:FixJ family two-component response regulator